MKSSPLQLRLYFVTELHVTANLKHDPEQPLALSADDILVTPDFLVAKDDPRQWQVTLRIQQQAGPSANPPYYFTVELVGAFDVAPNYPDEKVEWMVRTNASSMLYSTAREVLRGAMSQGPFCPLLLPTVSFYTADTMQMLEGAGKNDETPRAIAEGLVGEDAPSYAGGTPTQ